jgi:hypothetical protein
LLEAEGPAIDLPPWHYGLRLRRGEMRELYEEVIGGGRKEAKS